MTGEIGVNPLTGREKDVLSMCEHFLEDDRIKDQPIRYHKKLAMLTNTVTLLKRLYGDNLEVEHLIDFISKKEVMEKDLREVELRGSKKEELAAGWFKIINLDEEYSRVCAELTEELCKLPH